MLNRPFSPKSWLNFENGKIQEDFDEEVFNSEEEYQKYYTIKAQYEAEVTDLTLKIQNLEDEMIRKHRKNKLEQIRLWSLLRKVKELRAREKRKELLLKYK